MYPNATANDSLRMRYRQPQTPVTDYARPKPAPVVNNARPVARPQALRAPSVLAAASPAIAAPSPTVFELNLSQVPAAPVRRAKSHGNAWFTAGYALTVLAMMLIIMGGYVGYITLQNRQRAAQAASSAQQPKTQATAPAVNAEDTDNYDLAGYTVPADMPRYIRIGKLGTESRVVPVSADDDGLVSPTEDIRDTGWYDQSAKPGQKGATFISGSIASWAKRGVFHNLDHATPGTLIDIERGDGTIMTYKVKKVYVYGTQEVDMKQATTPVTLGKEGLNVMTFPSQQKSGPKKFDSRLLVMAERVS